MLVGVGNSLRCDDGAGIAVIRQLSDLGGLGSQPGIFTLEHHGEGLSLLDSWQNYPGVILIDATRSGKKPGTVQHFVVNCDITLPKNLFNYSSHLFGLAEAISLAQSLNCLPQEMEIFGIEGDEFGYGEKLTTEVELAVAQVVRTIESEL